LGVALEATGKAAGLYRHELEGTTKAVMALGITRQVAQEAGRSADSLSGVEKRNITMNAALRDAAKFTGVYKGAMQTAGGRMLSLQRRIDTLKDSFGSKLQPALIAAIGGAERLATALDNVLNGRAGGANGDIAPLFAPGLREPNLRELDPNYQTNLAAVNIDQAGGVLSSSLAKQIQRMREAQFRRTDTGAAGAFEMQGLIVFRDQEKAAKERLAKADAEREAFAKRAQDAIKETAKIRQEAELSELSALQRIRAERELALKQYGITKQAIEDVNAAFGIRERQELNRIQGEGAKVLESSFVDYRNQADARRAEDAKQFTAAIDLEHRRALM